MLTLKQCNKNGYTYITTGSVGFGSCDLFGNVNDSIFRFLSNNGKSKVRVRIEEDVFDLFKGSLIEIDDEIFAELKLESRMD